MENKSNIGINYAWRINRKLEAMEYNRKFWYVQSALSELMQKKEIKSRYFMPALSDGEESFLSFGAYFELERAARLFTLVGKTPRDLSYYNIEFLNGVMTDIKTVADEKLIEEYSSEGYKLVWLIIGQNAEIKMLAYVSESDGYVMPILDKEIESDYGGRDEENEDPKFWGQYRGDEDGYEYISELFDFLFDPNEDYSYSLETDNYLTDQDDIDYEDRDDNADDNEEEEGEWTEDIDDDEEDEVEWIYPDEDEEDEWTEDIDDEEDDEDEEEEGEWTEDIDDDDDGDINKVLAEETRLFDEHTITITVLSVTDLHEQPRTPEDGAVYDNIQGFVGKILPIVIGEEMTIYDPESNVVPIPEKKLHTSPVIFHSEELISENEIKHIVRTANSIYTFIEYKKER